MLTLLALILWMLAIPAFLGGMIWWGIGIGGVAFFVSKLAVDRRDDMEAFYGLCFMALLVMGAIRGVDALLP